MKVFRQKDSKFIFIKTFFGRCYTVYDQYTDLDKIFPYANIQEGIVTETNKQKFEKYIKAHGYMIVYIGWNRKIDAEKFEPESVVKEDVKKQIQAANGVWSKAKKDKKKLKKEMKRGPVNYQVSKSLKGAFPLPVDDLDVRTD